MEKENGGKERTHPIVTNMKASTKSTKNQDQAFSHGRAETSTAAVIKMMSDTAMEKCIGPMAAATKATGKMESNTDWAQ